MSRTGAWKRAIRVASVHRRHIEAMAGASELVTGRTVMPNSGALLVCGGRLVAVCETACPVISGRRRGQPEREVRVASPGPGGALPRLRLMHGMLSLGVLVAAFTVFAGWAAFVAVRLYRTCPLDQSRPDPVPRPEQEDQEESETTAETVA